MLSQAAEPGRCSSSGNVFSAYCCCVVVCSWIDAVFIPAVNRAGHDGWDMVKVVTDIKLAAEAQGNEVCVCTWTAHLCTSPS
jgi:hypothetical protein